MTAPMKVLTASRVVPSEIALRDARDFEQCYDAHKEQVFRVCLRYAGGRVDWAEDAMHDVFVKLWERMGELGDRGDLGGWLYRVATNVCLTRLRKDKGLWARTRHLLFEREESAPAAPDTLFDDKEAAGLALRMLEQLPARERVVLCMKVLDGKDQREIAATLSLSEGYVSKLLARAWARIEAAGWEVDRE